MDKILLALLILLSLGGLSAKHKFFRREKTWENAQKFCRKCCTDLSPITNELEFQVFQVLVGHRHKGWVGLYQNRSESDQREWRWSGGTTATDLSYIPFDPAQGQYAYWNKSSLVGSDEELRPIFCFKLIVEDVKKTWEEALEHCREERVDLTSLHSDTELVLALREIQNKNITERVWIGLRYFGDGWLWVDGDPLVYEAWPEGRDQDHRCPTWKRCGALTKKGHWENWDCGEKLNFICY